MTAQPKTFGIIEAGLQKRKAAVDAARASVRLEGFVLDEEAEKLFSRYVAGELSRPELNAAVMTLAGVHG